MYPDSKAKKEGKEHVPKVRRAPRATFARIFPEQERSENKRNLAVVAGFRFFQSFESPRSQIPVHRFLLDASLLICYWTADSSWLIHHLED